MRTIDDYRAECANRPPDAECPAFRDGKWPEMCACYHRSRKLKASDIFLGIAAASAMLATIAGVLAKFWS